MFNSSSKLRRWGLRLFGVYIISFCLVSQLGVSVAIAQPDSGEYPLKAGFVSHFLRLIRFTPSSGDFVLCVLDGDVVVKAFSALKKERVGEHNIRVTNLQDSVDFSSCRAIFIARSATASTEKVLRSVQGKEVLTIGEHSQFIHQGGIINFYTENKRIRFEININASTKAGLTISSKLLRLARIVDE